MYFDCNVCLLSDIKPENLMYLKADKRLLLIDYGEIDYSICCIALFAIQSHYAFVGQRDAGA